ncbi:DUF3892 domain-containing protein [Fodinisporobacter ferrooxydans]|uniref:DUF3892 domain-containing protein n=1 Tax=Fodinisporobacter ferrooxydans TaxID=2901836 RepID=A0ABY4CQR2_9BACL|nr:DUF3892 domain-containing protein [Alicyclobacillaceae bacterium MYW30-H2]
MLDPQQLYLVAAKKDAQGNVVAFRTNHGDVFSYAQALEFAKQGRIAEVEVYNVNGKEVLRAEDDGIEGNDLNDLPEFDQILSDS